MALRMESEPAQNNDQAIVFVWVGGVIPDHVIKKMADLKKRGYSCYLMHDPESIPPNDQQNAKDKLEKAKQFGDLLEIDRKDFLKNVDGISDDEKKQLLRGYLYQLYGHDYYADNDSYYNKLVQNKAAAADIARLIAIEQLKHLTNKKFIMYLDHDVMPMPSMDKTDTLPTSNLYQVHELGFKSGVVTSDKSNKKMEGFSLNNAVIRVSNDSNYCLDALKIIAKHYKDFSKVPAEYQMLMAMKHPLLKDHRLKFTFFIGGPHVLEALGYLNIYRYEKNNLLSDKGNNADFENTSAETWLTKYEPNSVYDEKNRMAEYDLLFLISSYLKLILEKSHTKINPINTNKNFVAWLKECNYPEQEQKAFLDNPLNNALFINLGEFHKLANINRSIKFIDLLDQMIKNDKKNTYDFLFKYHDLLLKLHDDCLRKAPGDALEKIFSEMENDNLTPVKELFLLLEIFAIAKNQMWEVFPYIKIDKIKSENLTYLLNNIVYDAHYVDLAFKWKKHNLISDDYFKMMMNNPKLTLSSLIDRVINHHWMDPFNPGRYQHKEIIFDRILNSKENIDFSCLNKLTLVVLDLLEKNDTINKDQVSRVAEWCINQAKNMKKQKTTNVVLIDSLIEKLNDKLQSIVTKEKATLPKSILLEYEQLVIRINERNYTKKNVKDFLQKLDQEEKTNTAVIDAKKYLKEALKELDNNSKAKSSGGGFFSIGSKKLVDLPADKRTENVVENKSAVPKLTSSSNDKGQE